MQEKYTLPEAAAIGGIVSIGSLVMGALFTVVAAALQVLWAWIYLHLWIWFAVPYLHAPKIGVLPAAGLLILVRAIIPSQRCPELKDDLMKRNSAWTKVLPYLEPFVVWGVGYVIHAMILRGW